jgi:hypothetical protein
MEHHVDAVDQYQPAGSSLMWKSRSALPQFSVSFPATPITTTSTAMRGFLSMEIYGLLGYAAVQSGRIQPKY